MPSHHHICSNWRGCRLPRLPRSAVLLKVGLVSELSVRSSSSLPSIDTDCSFTPCEPSGSGSFHATWDLERGIWMGRVSTVPGRVTRPETTMWTPGMPRLVVSALLTFIWMPQRPPPGAVKSAPCRTQTETKELERPLGLSLVSWMTRDKEVFYSQLRPWVLLGPILQRSQQV